MTHESGTELHSRLPANSPVDLRIGLLQLADSAPVIVAKAHGLFARHGLQVEIAVEPSWANLADKLTWGVLDAAVMFAPLALVTAQGARGRTAPLHLAQPISRGGNMIVLRGAPTDTFATWHNTLGRRPRIAVVHIHSTHHLLLRRFLITRGFDPDESIDLLVMPPARTVEALASGEVDGFCAGSPWGAEALLRGVGFEIAGSRHVAPAHLEKSLFIASEWAVADPTRLERLRKALAQARDICLDAAQHADLAALLAFPLDEGGLALPEAATLAALTGGRDQLQCEKLSFDLTVPTIAADLAWQLDDMRTLRWLPIDAPTRLEDLLDPAIH